MKKSPAILLIATWVAAGLTFGQSIPPKEQNAKSGSTPPVAAEVLQAMAAQEARLIALEKGTWEAAKRKDTAAFAAVCLDDCVEIWADGTVLPIKEVYAQLPDTEFIEVKFENMTATFPTEDTALVRYKVWANTTYKGRASPPQWVHATAVWVKKNGAWKCAIYQETALPKP